MLELICISLTQKLEINIIKTIAIRSFMSGNFLLHLTVAQQVGIFPDAVLLIIQND